MKYHKLAPTNDLNTWPVPNKQFDWSLWVLNVKLIYIINLCDCSYAQLKFSNTLLYVITHVWTIGILGNYTFASSLIVQVLSL